MLHNTGYLKNDNIPSLRADLLSATIPTAVYAGGPVVDPEQTLFIFRSGGLQKARGMTMAFFTDDSRFTCVWANPARYADLFLRHGIQAAIEPDFSLWTNEALIQQAYNVFRMRTVGRLWQEAGIPVIPNLTWSNERSFSFCFRGIPRNAPVVATECRTPGGNDDDRRAFLRGLAEAVRQVQPQNVCVYGGATHKHWLTGNLPEGPTYHLIESWTDARRRVRREEERRERDRYQPDLFLGGTSQWADGEAQAAA